jgi:mRNA interferase RelE/StbE
LTYDVVFDEEVLDFLERMPKQLRKRIYLKVISAKENPFHFFDRLEGRKDYRLRIGDYRVIADIDAASRSIQVTLVGHRRNVYG